MLNLRHPSILIPVSVVPMCILGWLFYGTFQLVEVHLTDAYVVRWTIESALLILLWITHLAVIMRLFANQKKTDIRYAQATLIIYIMILILFFVGSPKLLPYYLPGWITRQNLIIYAGCFILPTVLHALFVLASHQSLSKEKMLRPAVGVIVVSGVWCIQHFMLKPPYMAAVILYLVNFIGIAYFLLIIGYKLYRSQANSFRHLKLITKLCLVIAFPLAGFLLNNDMFFPLVMGKHLDTKFFILTIINAIGLCLPNASDKYYRLFLFMIRSVTTVYIFFHFLIFVPELPLSALVMINLGLGVLVSSPVIIMVFYSRVVVKDFSFLYRHFSYRTVNCLFLTSILIMPALISIT